MPQSAGSARTNQNGWENSTRLDELWLSASTSTPTFGLVVQAETNSRNIVNRSHLRTIRPRCIDLNFTNLSRWRNNMYGEKEEAGLC
jgi:hypothetical protein